MKKEEIELRVEPFVEELIEGDQYVKYEGAKVEKWGFYLRFIGKWFIPCEEDQLKLKKLVFGSDKLIIGNKDYENPIELNMTFEIEDDSFIEIERRKPTEEELKYLKKWD